MRAIAFDPSSDRFSLRDLPVPAVSDGEVRVKVAACGLNPVDAKIDLWKDAAVDMSDTWVGGLDVSGTIDAVGAGVTEWRVGDRVLYHGNMFRPNGGFAEFATHKAATLVAHPDLPSATAAATPCTGWTAWRAMLDKLRVAKDMPIFINGAGAVGLFAIQIARMVGAHPIIATCSENTDSAARASGATHTINYRTTPNIPEAVRAICPDGVARAFDTVGMGGDILAAQCLGYEGEMLALVDEVRPSSYPEPFMQGLSFHQLSLGSGHRNGPQGEMTLLRAGHDFNAAFTRGDLTVPSFRTVAFEDMPARLSEIRTGRPSAKFVLEP
ncbi:NADPH:quinone reductase-like Zn-dependent oxidoreductase [Shimia isoporae]|uniref:NADPH:quinone reductase-like Zn-dependent oxidoreductase n=1 Tax=Shimia isoporae TaxID=647720 RepID=A0A4R1NV26_9RHOB|nr:zinc-binding dehydrogenase [Shimia isoporae]TCL08912.1 NADPH:quinone reductase-like Zn-dependent oxidoreductase [Shimia isoporae]